MTEDEMAGWHHRLDVLRCSFAIYSLILDLYFSSSHFCFALFNLKVTFQDLED